MPHSSVTALIFFIKSRGAQEDGKTSWIVQSYRFCFVYWFLLLIMNIICIIFRASIEDEENWAAVQIMLPPVLTVQV